MKLKNLQKKYPEFVYENFGWEIKGGVLVAHFCFAMGDIKFSPGIKIRKINKTQIKKIGDEAISNFVFHMGLAEIPSYWKAACCPEIIVKAGYLDKEQIKFWQNLIEEGMGQFFYENKLPFVVPHFEIHCKIPKKHPHSLPKKFSKRVLVPMGGGKDSLVTLELLRQTGEDVVLFVLNPNEKLQKICRAVKKPTIAIERQIDSRLLSSKNFFNGHTPFSALLAAYSMAVAAISDCGRIAISQERSSSEGNARYLGKEVNHQYSKSLDFENKFRFYSKKYLAKNIDFFSFLRPIYELQIAMLFSRHPKWFSRFISCNKPFTIANRQNKNIGWCGKCPKCLSVFTMIYSFIGKERAIKIFGKNLFENINLLPLMKELLGETGCKPFECVGTFAETRVAFYLSLEDAKREGNELPVLLNVFEQEFLPKYGDIKLKSQKILSSWDNNHNLPKNFENKLKSAVRAAG
jgi:hypothetical protein